MGEYTPPNITREIEVYMMTLMLMEQYILVEMTDDA